MGSRLKKLRVIASFPGDVAHRLDELVESLLALRLSRLDHQRFFYLEGKVHRRRVEPKVDQTLGNVESPHPMLAEVRDGEDNLVHAVTVVGQGIVAA